MSDKTVPEKRISIVIPTYQSKKQLGNTLRALNRQKGVADEDFEVIVVDDGSSDGTCEYVKAIEKNYDFHYIYLERTQGSSRSKTRNTGIMAAKGEIIVFLDSDILVKEDYVSQVLGYFAIDKDILLVGHRIMLTEEVTPEDLSEDNLYSGEKFRIKCFDNFEVRHALFLDASYNSRRNKYPWIHVYSCNMAVGRELLDRAGYFDEAFKGWGLEDLELGYRLYKCGAKVITGVKIEVYHQPHTTIINNDSKAQEEREKEVEANTLYFIEKHPEAFDYPTPVVLDYFKGKSNEIRLDIEYGVKTEIEINFRDRSELDSVKAGILKSTDRENCVVVVYDYVEDTDLDIWIQLLEGVKTIPRYYPELRGRIIRNIGDADTRVEIYKID